MDPLSTGRPLLPAGRGVALFGQYNVRDCRHQALRGDARDARAGPINIVATSRC